MDDRDAIGTLEIVEHAERGAPCGADQIECIRLAAMPAMQCVEERAQHPGFDFRHVFEGCIETDDFKHPRSTASARYRSNDALMFRWEMFATMMRFAPKASGRSPD